MLTNNNKNKPVLTTASESAKVQLNSPKYYVLCAVGGFLSCGIVHALVTPIDLVKCM